MLVNSVFKKHHHFVAYYSHNSIKGVEFKVHAAKLKIKMNMKGLFLSVSHKMDISILSQN
jgi:hypothetical protein